MPMLGTHIGLAIWRLKYFYETFVQGSRTVILLKLCAKNPPHRQALTVSGNRREKRSANGKHNGIENNEL